MCSHQVLCRAVAAPGFFGWNWINSCSRESSSSWKSMVSHKCLPWAPWSLGNHLHDHSVCDLDAVIYVIIGHLSQITSRTSLLPTSSLWHLSLANIPTDEQSLCLQPQSPLLLTSNVPGERRKDGQIRKGWHLAFIVPKTTLWRLVNTHRTHSPWVAWAIKGLLFFSFLI